ncbi:MAG: HNH endonuclease [Clostridium sp.]|nr:HNH endonuclease [Clostridium sp.]
MAKEFSKSFYKSKAWKETREYIFIRDKGLCQDCLEKGILTPGKEVHHIKHLTPDNINDNDIALGEHNLRLLCKECHHKRHKNNKCLDDDLMFDEFGNLIKK